MLALLENAGTQNAFIDIEGVVLNKHFVNGEGIVPLTCLVNFEYNKSKTIGRSLDRSRRTLSADSHI